MAKRRRVARSANPATAPKGAKGKGFATTANGTASATAKPATPRAAPLETEDGPSERRQSRLDLFNLVIAAISMVLSLAAVVFSVLAFNSSERAEGPIVEVGAFHSVQTRTETQVEGQKTSSDTFDFDVLVLVNRGRTPLDLVRVQPIDQNGDRQLSKVIFSAKYCEREGHATIEPGAGLPVALLPQAPGTISGKWEVAFATGVETVELKLETDLGTSDPAGIAGSYDSDAEALLQACGVGPPDLR